MKIRDKKPECGNKFYNTISNGGLSTCIKGKPVDKECDVLSNCVGYACGRFNEIIGEMKYPYLNCNAENFIERAKEYGLEVSTVPTLGGIMVFQKGNTLHGGDGAGHVFIVEKIISDTEIITSESAWCGRPFYTRVRKNIRNKWGMNNDYYFRGCIINPAIGKITANLLDNFTDIELAHKVINGEFGNGEERKHKLGIRYFHVQSEVNNILNKDNILLEQVKNVIAGNFGNGSQRKSILGDSYDEVQRQVNLNYKNNTIDNPRLY